MNVTKLCTYCFEIHALSKCTESRSIKFAAHHGYDKLSSCYYRFSVDRVQGSICNTLCSRIWTDKIVELLLRDSRVDPSTRPHAISWPLWMEHDKLSNCYYGFTRWSKCKESIYNDRAAENGMKVVESITTRFTCQSSAGYRCAIKNAAGRGRSRVVKLLLRDPVSTPVLKINMQ